MKTKIIILILIFALSMLLGIGFSSNVKAQPLTLPIKSITRSDIINQILADSEWVYDEYKRELKLCFYLIDGSGSCTIVPKQYIIIKVIDKPSI